MKRGRPYGTTKPNPRSVQLAQRYTVEEREAIIKAAGGPRKACTYIRDSVITRLLSEKVIAPHPDAE